MAVHTIPDGVWPTMVTPYREDRSIDYAALEAMVEVAMGLVVEA